MTPNKPFTMNTGEALSQCAHGFKIPECPYDCVARGLYDALADFVKLDEALARHMGTNLEGVEPITSARAALAKARGESPDAK